MTSKTIVIYDVSTFVGSNLASFLKKKHKVFGLYRTNPVDIPGVICLQLNILDRRESKLVLSTISPDVIIFNTTASASTCEQDSFKDMMLHRSGISNINEICSKNDIKFIYISSYFVFRGEDKVYVETGVCDPLTAYGKLLSSMEFMIQRSFNNYLIIRTSNLYGRGILYAAPKFMEKIERDIYESNQISIDNKVKCGFLDVDYLSLVIDLALEGGFQNRLWQLSSKDIITNFEFTNLYAEIFFKINQYGINGLWSFPFRSMFVAAQEVGKINYLFQMSTENLENTLAISMPTVRESLEFTFKKFAGKDGKRVRELFNFI